MSDRFAVLQAHQAKVADRAILSLFDDNRAQDFSVQVDGMLFDFSKTNIDAAALAQLLALTTATGLAEKRSAMFGGQKINDTEGRAVLHEAKYEQIDDRRTRISGAQWIKAPQITIKIEGSTRVGERAIHRHQNVTALHRQCGVLISEAAYGEPQAGNLVRCLLAQRVWQSAVGPVAEPLH